ARALVSRQSACALAVRSAELHRVAAASPCGVDDLSDIVRRAVIDDDHLEVATHAFLLLEPRQRQTKARRLVSDWNDDRERSMRRRAVSDHSIRSASTSTPTGGARKSCSKGERTVNLLQGAIPPKTRSIG